MASHFVQEAAVIVGNSVFLIPLQNTPQVFPIQLAGKDYLMTVRWNNAPDAGWAMDLQDGNTLDSIVSNIPFVTGSNLLAGLDYLGIEGEFYVYTDGDQNSIPTLTNLGVESNLYFVTSVPNG